MTQRVTIKVDSVKLARIQEYYHKDQKENSGEYITFFAKNDEIVVTCYTSKKANDYKVMFLGANALEEAKKWDINAELNKAKAKGPSKASWILLDEQIGSDEVGTGDFFGPISVCAAYVSKKDIKRLKELGVDDSKRLSDSDILRIGKVLINEISYSQVALTNEKYNELVSKGMNMNEMKSKMHNQVLLNLKKKHPDVKSFVQDQFLEADKYFAYLFGIEEVVEDITFRTKGESYYPSIACASIISRYSFLQKMEALKKAYGVDIPFGASSKVTQCAIKIAKKFGIEELNKIVKKNFANYDEVLKSI